jgi:hypothetical protein
VGGELPQRDARRGVCIGYTEPWKVPLNGCVPFDLARFDKLHDGQGGERFRQRGDGERGLRRTGWTRNAEPTQMHDLLATDDAQCDARQAGCVHPRRDIAIDHREGGCVLGGQNGLVGTHQRCQQHDRYGCLQPPVRRMCKTHLPNLRILIV